MPRASTFTPQSRVTPDALAMRRPPDADSFVQRAEEISNSTDVDAALAVYAPDAVLETITDGTVIVHRGIDEIRAGVKVMWSVARSRGLRISKQLVAATDDTIINTWDGQFARGRTRGAEIWRFDESGRVCHQQMFNYLDVRPENSVRQRIRTLVLYPRTALAFLRAQAADR